MSTAGIFLRMQNIIEKLEAFSKANVDEEVLLTVLKTQELVKEIYSDGSNN